MKHLLLIALLAGSAAHATDVYTKQTPKEVLTKIEAMKVLLTSDNKEKVLRCREVKLSDKGTVTYK